MFELELYKPTEMQRRIEALVTNQVGISLSFHSEETELSLQSRLGHLELKQGNKGVEKAVKFVDSLLSINCYVRQGLTAGGLWALHEFNNLDDLVRVVNSGVAYTRANPLPQLPRLFTTDSLKRRYPATRGTVFKRNSDGGRESYVIEDDEWIDNKGRLHRRDGSREYSDGRIDQIFRENNF